VVSLYGVLGPGFSQAGGIGTPTPTLPHPGYFKGPPIPIETMGADPYLKIIGSLYHSFRPLDQ
jgi:hypothetical protein